MGKSCTILAHVRNEKGEIVESKLFKDLLKFTNNDRSLTKQYYAVGSNNEFLEMARERDGFATDENGEITLPSLVKIAKLELDKDIALRILNKEFGEGRFGYSEALRKVRAFNESSPYRETYMATMNSVGGGEYYVSVVQSPQKRPVSPQKTSGDDFVHMTVRDFVKGDTLEVMEEKNAAEEKARRRLERQRQKSEQSTRANENQNENNLPQDERQKLHEIVLNQEVANKIKDLLRSHGVSVDFIDSDRKGGRYSTANAQRLENGLYGLISVNNNEHVSDELAEEAGHFAVGALGKNPLVERAENLLKSQAVREEALGQEYEDAQLGDNPARETLGRLVGKALARKLSGNSTVKVLANRIANLAKRVFYGITGNEVRWAHAKAEQIANEIAYGFAKGDKNFSVQNALGIQETMNNATLTMNQKTYRKAIDELGRAVERLKAISQTDSITGQMQASLAFATYAGTNEDSGQSALQMIDAFADTYSFNGLVEALAQATGYFEAGKEYDQLIESIDLDNPSNFKNNMARYGRNLREARVLLNATERILNVIGEAVDPAHLGGSIKLVNGESLDNVSYKSADGEYEKVNLKWMLDTYTRVLANNERHLNNLESSYFAKFCEDVYGGKYITTTVGKLWSDIANRNPNSGEEVKYSIEDLIEGNGMNDIDIFHRYLGSMSNNPDIIGQIVDKCVKSANKVADDQTINYCNRLEILRKRAEDMGIDMKDLMERDSDGNLTGNIIMPPASPSQHGNAEQDFIYEAYMDDLGYVPAVNFGNWENARRKFKEEQWEEFKQKNPDWEGMSGIARGLNWDNFFRERMKEWNNNNSIKVKILDGVGEIKNIKWMPNGIYQSEAWSKVNAKYQGKKGDSLSRWINDYMQIKAELDSMLPKGSTSSFRLPQFRGALSNSIRQQMEMDKSGRLKAAAKAFGRRKIIENFVETAEDTDYGSLHTMNSPDEQLLGTELAYEKERAARIPVFGINKLKNMQDLSSDICTSMKAYASMATSYQCIDAVVDALEVGRNALSRRKLDITLANKVDTTIRNVFRSKKKFNSLSGYDKMMLTGSGDYAYGRYCKFLDAQVYGISSPFIGLPIGGGKKILYGKCVMAATGLAGLIYLQGNVHGGIVNGITGFNNIFKEAAAGDYFDLADWAYAHKYYFSPSNFMAMWSDAGQEFKDNRLNMFLQKMNSQGNNKERFRRARGNRFSNLLRNIGYFPYSGPDHYMQAMSYLAVAHGTKLYDPQFGELADNLWDAYEVEDNADADNPFKAGKRISFKRFCPLNATDITYDEIQWRGVYLKQPQATTAAFEDWLVAQDPEFGNEGYKKAHPKEYNDYREKFNSLTGKQRLDSATRRYNTALSILGKVESHLASSSPLASVPSFSNEEEAFLKAHGLSTENYKNIQQVAKDEIYKLIWTEADNSAYMDKCREVNNRMHGIYNRQDKTAMHQDLFSNAYLAMKGWILGYIENMWSNNHFSLALGKNVEGFIQSYLKVPADYVVGTILKDPKRMSFRDMWISMLCPWSKRSLNAMKKAGFSEEQNKNCRRMVITLAIISLLKCLRLATAPPDDDNDDDEIDPVQGTVYYFATRAMFEQMAFVEVGETYTQSGQIANIIPPGFDAFYDLFIKLPYEVAGAALTSSDNKDFYYQKDDQKGKYLEGDAKWEAHLARLIPYYKSIWGIEHPYKLTENYMFGRKMSSK